MAKIIIESNGENSFKFKKDFDTEFEVKAKNFELKKIDRTKPTYWVRASQVFSGELLFQEDISEVEVDGTVYNNYEDLSEVLTPILFKKGRSSGGGGGGGIESIQPGENITINNTDPKNPIISSTGGGGGSSVWTSDLFLAFPFGKYSAGSTVPSTGKTDEEIIRDAYQGVLDAVIVNPTFGLTRSNSGTTLLEVGASTTFDLVGSYNPGGIYGKMISGSWQTGVSEANKQANRAGNITSMTIDGEVFTDGVTPKTRAVTKTILVGANNFSGTATFLAGTNRPKRSNGIEYGSVYTTPLTLTSNTPAITGLYPYFYGFINPDQTIDDVNISTLTKVVAGSTGTISIPYSGVVGKRLVILIPSTSTLKTKWFVNALNSGNIGNTGDLFPTVSTRNYNSPTGLWTAQSFRVYLSDTTNLNETIQLQN